MTTSNNSVDFKRNKFNIIKETKLKFSASQKEKCPKKIKYISMHAVTVINIVNSNTFSKIKIFIK